MSAYLTWPSTQRSLAGSIYFDAVTSETVVYGSTVTEFPVEKGANISDHVRENLDKVSLEVFVSNHPIDGVNRLNPNKTRGQFESVALDIPVFKRPINSLSAAISAGLGALSRLIFGEKDPERAVLLQFGSAFSATQETHEALRQILAEKRLIDIHTRDWHLDNMILESVTAPRTAENGSGAVFNLEFRQIRIVETLQTFSPVAAEPRGKAVAKAGVVGPQPTTADRAKSILAGTADFIKGGF